MLSKIMFLREERDLLMEEKIENDQLGKKIAANLESVAKSGELDKFRQFLEEIEQITKLTVSLTIRLSRLSRKMESGSLSKDELVSVNHMSTVNSFPCRTHCKSSCSILGLTLRVVYPFISRGV